MAKANKSNDGKGKKTFFFKRWMTGLSNVLDRWLFNYTSENGVTFGETFWMALVVGFIGGGISIAPQIFSEGNGITPTGQVATIISSSIALILIVIYGYGNILSFESTKKRILRGVFIFIWGIFGYGFGYLLGAVIVGFVILLIFLWFILKLFGTAAFGSSSSSSGSSSSNNKNEPERYELEDGTVVEDIGFGKYREADKPWGDTYTRDGNYFTKEQ